MFLFLHSFSHKNFHSAPHSQPCVLCFPSRLCIGGRR